MKTDNVIVDKSKIFAIEIIKVSQRISSEKKEYVMSKQILRSGTSIGANVREAVRGESSKDFVHKLSISRKEAYETQYWLELLFETGYIEKAEFVKLNELCIELLKILTAIIKTSQK